MHSGEKYFKWITSIDGGRSRVDVYALLEAFEVTCPARQHAIKKLLCAGKRGKGDSLSDLKEARDAVSRAIDMVRAKIEIFLEAQQAGDGAEEET